MFVKKQNQIGLAFNIIQYLYYNYVAEHGRPVPVLVRTSLHIHRRSNVFSVAADINSDIFSVATDVNSDIFNITADDDSNGIDGSNGADDGRIGNHVFDIF